MYIKVILKALAVLVMGAAMGTASAKPVDVTTARCVANTWMSAQGMKNTEALVDITSATPYTEFYIFAASEGGFVLVSGDDCVTPVLGYSVGETFAATDMPENLRDVLDSYERIIRSAKQNGEPSLTKEWRRVTDGKLTEGRKSVVVAPLLTTTWNQTPYYNALCPYDSVNNGRTVTGCVATATAQVMKYHNYPVTGYGTHTNSRSSAIGPLTVDFGATTYDWTHMPDALTAASSATEVNAVATLMYHVGVGCDMSYSAIMSGSSNINTGGKIGRSAQTALMSYFKYRPDMVVLLSQNFSNEEYCSRLRAELDQSRPILYQGSDGGSTGHSFVCDGYTDNNLFHINWGWGGLADGYYAMGNLVPQQNGVGANSGNYSLENAAIVGIRPNDDWGAANTVVSATITGPGTISGTGTYAFGDTVTLDVAVPEGCRFSTWSDGAAFFQRQFVAQGGSYSFTAQVEALGGDTLCYGSPYIKPTTSLPFNRWGIRLPASVLTDGRFLKEVQLFVSSSGTYTLTVFAGTAAPTDTLFSTTQQFGSLDVDRWNSFPVTSLVPIDTTRNLWLTFSCNDATTPATITYSCGNTDEALIGDSLAPADDGFMFLIRGILDDGSSALCAVNELAWDEGFEEGADCWSRMGVGAWNVESGAGHSGSACLASTGNAWAISPAIVLPADSSNIGLSYYVDAPVGLAYEVRISTGGDDLTHFTTLIYTEGGSTSGWQQRAISLAPYAGQTVYIAFHCLAPMRLDDIRVGQNDSALVYHYIFASVNNPFLGCVSGSGLYVEGDTVTLQAVPAAGCQFAYWTSGILTPTLTFIATANYSFTANFITQRPERSGDTVSYCASDPLTNKITNGSPNFHFGMMLPATALTGCDFLRSVMLYSTGACDYTLNVYRGGDTVPGTLVHTQPVSITSGSEGWQEIGLTDSVFTQGENLWLTFCITEAGHTMAVSDYAGMQGGYISNNGTSWGTIASRGFLKTFMIKGVFGEADTSNATKLTNLVIFVRFADDEEIDHSFGAIDSMFNSHEEGFYSVYNFYDALTYGRIHYKSVYTSNIQNGQIVSYVDPFPRGTFQPYSEENPIGYHGELPFVGISMLEAQLLARIFTYVDTMHLVPTNVVLDGDGDGNIDNVSIIVKGGVGSWASLLWPHMEFFPHDSIGHTVTINGVSVNTFNFEFEDAGAIYFAPGVFCHEMGHSLKLPDLYHYTHYTDVMPAGSWDYMNDNHRGPNHTAAIYKNKILHVADDPIEITADGDYTLYSVGGSASQNCYYIRSAIDSNQWFTFEYRNQDDPFESNIPGSGLLAARWVDTVPINYAGMFANAFFDGGSRTHQYWIFRPHSNYDTVNGNLFNAHFSFATGRTAFGPTTDPHPYLTDGTTETSFEITDIRENGTELTFHVHFLNNEGVEDVESDNVRVFVRDGRIVVEGAEGETVGIYDIMGRSISNKALPTGVYIVKVGSQYAQKVVVLNR